MAPNDILFAIGCGIIVLVLYTYVVIDIAATVAVRRIERSLGWDQEEIDELERMMRDHTDE